MVKQYAGRRGFGIFISGLFVGLLFGGCFAHWAGSNERAAHAQERQTTSLPALAQETKTLGDKVPDQAHAMMDVDYHFTNLWFAAKANNWPLADFYWKETRSHMRWAVRIIPVRKDSEGREIKLQEILQAVENTPLAQLKQAIEARDGKRFEAAYRSMLESCYSCHKASGKPYLRPQTPLRPATQIINFDPQATWPK